MQAANYIGGEWLTADSDKAIVDLNPADTRDVLAELPLCWRGRSGSGAYCCPEGLSRLVQGAVSG